MPDTPQKKSARRSRPMKSAELISLENVAYLKRNQPKNDDVQNKKENRIKKWQQSSQKETTAKRTQPKQATRFNGEITVVVGWRFGYLHDLQAEFVAKLTRNNSIECNKCQRPLHLKCANMTRSYFTCQNCESDADVSSEAGQYFFYIVPFFFSWLRPSL